MAMKDTGVILKMMLSNIFLNNLNKINIKIEAITIRPHPSDYKGKYSWTLNNELVTSISHDKTLIQDISEFRYYCWL